MTAEPQTDQDWAIAALELCGWRWYRHPVVTSDSHVYRFLAHPASHEFEQSPDWTIKADGTEKPCTMEYMSREFHLPNLRSVDACLEYLAPIMGARGYGINLDVTAPGLRSVARFYRWDHSYEAEEGMDLALAIVKAFVKSEIHSQQTSIKQ